MATFVWNLLNIPTVDKRSKGYKEHKHAGHSEKMYYDVGRRGQPPNPPWSDTSVNRKAAWWFEEIAQEKQTLQTECEERSEAKVVAQLEEEEERYRRVRKEQLLRSTEKIERMELREKVRRMEEIERQRLVFG